MTSTNINVLTQAEAAAFCDVDRTTIRAWQQTGMPYTKPEKKGGQGAYHTSILINWLYFVVLQKDPVRGPRIPKNITPPQAIVYCQVLLAGDDGEEAVAARAHNALAGYFERSVIDRAIGYALALTSHQRAA